MEASPEIEEKVEKLLQQMTLAEKIGQLNQSNANGVATGPQKAQDDFYKQLEAAYRVDIEYSGCRRNQKVPGNSGNKISFEDSLAVRV